MKRTPDPRARQMWGALLREAREQEHYSRRQLAELIGYSQTAIYQWETGRHFPTLRARNRLATDLRAPYLKASMNWWRPSHEV